MPQVRRECAGTWPAAWRFRGREVKGQRVRDWVDCGRRGHVCCVHRMREPTVCVRGVGRGGVLARSCEPLGAHERFVYVRACAPKLRSRCLGLWGPVRCVSEAGTHRVRRVHALPRVERSPDPLRMLGARARLHPLGGCELPPGAGRVGEGKRASPGRARPRPRLPAGSPGPGPHLLGRRGGPGGVARRSPAEPGRGRAAPHSRDSSRSRARVRRGAGSSRAARVCVWVCGAAGVGAGARARGRLRVGAPPECARSRAPRCPAPVPSGAGRPEAGAPRAARR